MVGKRGQKEARAGESTYSLGCRKGRGFAQVLSSPDGPKRSPVMGSPGEGIRSVTETL